MKMNINMEPKNMSKPDPPGGKHPELSSCSPFVGLAAGWGLGRNRPRRRPPAMCNRTDDSHTKGLGANL